MLRAQLAGKEGGGEMIYLYIFVGETVSWNHNRGANENEWKGRR